MSRNDTNVAPWIMVKLDLSLQAKGFDIFWFQISSLKDPVWKL